MLRGAAYLADFGVAVSVARKIAGKVPTWRNIVQQVVCVAPMYSLLHTLSRI